MSVFALLSRKWALAHRSIARLSNSCCADLVLVGILLLLPILVLLIPGTAGAAATMLIAAVNVVSVVGEATQRILSCGGATHPKFRTASSRALREEFPLIVLCVFVLCILLNFAALYAALERVQPAVHFGGASSPIGLFDSLYYSFSVVSTVGLGDVYPTSVAAKALTMTQMASVFVLVFVALSMVAGRQNRAG